MPARKLAITVPEEIASEVEIAAQEDTGGNVSAIATEAFRAFLRGRALQRAIAAQEAQIGPIADEEVDELWRKYGLD